MKNATVNAIILGNKTFGETDKLVFLYCEKLGKIKAIAKGARRITSKFTGHLETLNFVQISLYFGPKNIILTEIITTGEKRLRPKNKLGHLKAAIQIAEITNKLLGENQEINGLGDTLKETIIHLTSTEKPELTTIAYIIKILDKAGAMPNFREIQTKLPEKYLKFLQYVKSANYEAIEKISLKTSEKYEIENFIIQLFQFTFDLNFSSLDTFKTPRTFSSLSNSKSN